MDRWKVEQCSLVGSETILNQLEHDGYEIRYLELIETEGLAPVQGVEPGVGGPGNVVGRFPSFRVFIVARKRD